MKEPQLSVIIPTYNEKDNIEEILNRLEKTLKNISYEVIFVDDDSPDGTGNTVKRQRQSRPYVQLIQRVGRRGLAGAVIEGILSSKSKTSAVMDCDLQHDETKLIEMLSLFKKNPKKSNYLYFLTPQGIKEKTNLTLNFMKRKMREYDELKKEIE